MSDVSEARIKVGVVGCGNVSSVYFEHINTRYKVIDVVACADLLRERSQGAADRFGIPNVLSTEELMAYPQVELVLNLTNPDSHAEVSLSAIDAGKHVYSEKPLAVRREDGQAILDSAAAKGLMVGCAPDTVLGAGIQTCRKVIDEGAIGDPIGATAFMVNHGHEAWHPNPEFYYKVGGGPMFDMGPYYLSTLVNLMGPVKRVTGSHRRTSGQRTITSEPLNGTVIDVDVSTHVIGVLDFESGAIASIITSFDVWGSDLPRIEVYGTEGALSVPDPNLFDGQVKLMRAGDDSWTEVPSAYQEGGRGMGLAEMAWAIHQRRPGRASGDVANHVLDIMHAVHEACDEGRHVDLTATCERPAMVPTGLAEGVFDS